MRTKPDYPPLTADEIRGLYSGNKTLQARTLIWEIHRLPGTIQRTRVDNPAE